MSKELIHRPRIGDAGFDPNEQEKAWPTKPISIRLIEYHGDGDPAFGGSADDRAVLACGRVADRLDLTKQPLAEFTTVEEAHRFAMTITNRRQGSILGMVPKWR